MTVEVYTLIEYDNRSEYGYGLYVNAYVIDTEFEVPGTNIDGKCGLYASECVPFNADSARITRAQRRVRQNARRRYLKEKQGE